jgi:hypothetical protein
MLSAGLTLPVSHKERNLKMNQLLAVLVCLAVGVGLGWMLTAPSQSTPIPIQSSVPTIEHIQPLAALVSMRVDISDVQVSSLDGYTGGIRIALLIRGDFLMTVNLSRARFESLDKTARTAILVLPDPVGMSPRLDQERTVVFSIDTHGMWQMIPSDRGRAVAVDQAMRQAQRLLTLQARKSELVERAKARTESLVTSFLKQTLDWKVSVKWETPPADET